MPSIMQLAAPAVKPTSPVPACDEPVSILAALIGALMEPERYSIVTRDGELFITPAR